MSFSKDPTKFSREQDPIKQDHLMCFPLLHEAILLSPSLAHCDATKGTLTRDLTEGPPNVGLFSSKLQELSMSMAIPP
jgi:hypothetical protein